MTETPSHEPLRLNGSAYQRGLQQARLRPDLVAAVRAAVGSRLQALDDLPGRPFARDFLQAQMRGLREQDPVGFDESRGIAEGYGLTHDELLAYLHANVLTDLGATPATAADATDEFDGCTAWGLRLRGGGARMAKNRDYRGEHGRLQQVFVHEDPAAASPRILCVGSLGSPGAFSSGINGHGLAVVDTQIATRDHGPGWLRYFLMTALLWRCRSVDEALAFVRAVPHAGGGTLVIGDALGCVAAVELSHRGGVVAQRGPAWVARTNHFLDPALAGQALPPADDLSDSSVARLQTVRKALCAATADIDLDQARALMSGHDEPGALCRHAAPGRSGTLSCVIYETATATLTMSHGRPCDAAWASYRLHADGVTTGAYPTRAANRSGRVGQA